MQVSKKSLPKGEVELLIELSLDELKPFIASAAKEISQTKKIAGFRPGHAPLDIVIKEAGEMFVYQTAASQAIEATVYSAIDEQGMEVIDQPKIEVQKLAPGNPFIYKATAALVPEIKICELDKLKIKSAAEIAVEDKEIEKVIADLQKMRAKETLENKAAEKGDKIELAFDVFVDNVPIEGGQAKKHSMILGEGQMIPGFEDNLVGLKKDEEKEFELIFPKKYHNKNLENKKAVFKVKMIAVYKVELPKMDDEFGKSLGLKDLTGLKKTIGNNLRQEKELKEKQRIDLEIMEQMLEKSTFGEIPDVLIDQETHKMTHELEDNIAQQGMKFEDYLTHLKKTEGDLRLDFVPDAIKRVKTGLIIRALAKRENIQANDQEIGAERERTLASYKLHPAYGSDLDKLEKNLRSENATHYFANVIANRKTMEFLKTKVFGVAKPEN